MKQQTFEESKKLSDQVTTIENFDCKICNGADWFTSMAILENAILEVIPEFLRRMNINQDEEKLRLLAAEIAGRARRGENWQEVVDDPIRFIQST